MCTSPIRIINKSHYHNPKAIRLYMYVPCGKCPECIRQRQTEWRLRSNIEYADCIKNGGFVYFDTATYRPNDTPVFRGHPCFNRSHVQQFLKDMRKRIAKDKGICNDGFKVFYVSEYGERHKKPHYHFLFYVRDNRITPVYLKSIIKDCWKYGFTDLRNAVNPHVGVVRSVAACTYVSKYVTKPDDYVEDLYNSMRSEVSREEFRKHFAPFHQQSLSFGKSLLSDKSQMAYFKDLKCYFNTNIFKLPLYYVRKLYFRLVDNPDGSSSWRPTSLGEKVLSAYKYKLYEDYTSVVDTFVKSIPSYLDIPKVFSSVVDTFRKFHTDTCKDFALFDYSRESVSKFFARFDSNFVSDYSFWKRFSQGYLIKDKSFNPLIDTVNDESKDLIYFDLQGSKSLPFVSDLNQNYSLGFRVFDTLFNVIRSQVGECDKYLVNLQKTLNSIFNVSNVA